MGSAWDVGPTELSFLLLVRSADTADRDRYTFGSTIQPPQTPHGIDVQKNQVFPDSRKPAYFWLLEPPVHRPIAGADNLFSLEFINNFFLEEVDQSDVGLTKHTASTRNWEHQ